MELAVLLINENCERTDINIITYLSHIVLLLRIDLSVLDKNTTMTKEISQRDLSIFEQIKLTDEFGNEYWGARQLAKVLEYTDFRNFISVIGKAKEACKNSGQPIKNHLVDFNEMVPIGSGAERQMESVKLSRYACYLIVQNADPSKVLQLSKTVLDKYKIRDTVEMILEKEQIVIRVSTKPRKGWDEAFITMNENGDDQLLMNDVFDDETSMFAKHNRL